MQPAAGMGCRSDTMLGWTHSEGGTTVIMDDKVVEVEMEKEKWKWGD